MISLEPAFRFPYVSTRSCCSPFPRHSASIRLPNDLFIPQTCTRETEFYGWPGLGFVWARVLLDIAITAPEEHSQC